MQSHRQQSTVAVILCEVNFMQTASRWNLIIKSSLRNWWHLTSLLQMFTDSACAHRADRLYWRLVRGQRQHRPTDSCSCTGRQSYCSYINSLQILYNTVNTENVYIILRANWLVSQLTAILSYTDFNRMYCICTISAIK